MKASTTPFDTLDNCPRCDAETSVVKLGGEPAREICIPFNCDWEGRTLE